jgi:hypothetical protein
VVQLAWVHGRVLLKQLNCVHASLCHGAPLFGSTDDISTAFAALYLLQSLLFLCELPVLFPEQLSSNFNTI